MARLIDADKLNEDCEIFGAWDAKIVQEWLNDQPTVNAVEVVRCHECKYAVMSSAGYCEYCKLISESFQVYFAGDHFCSYGERRDRDGKT